MASSNLNPELKEGDRVVLLKMMFDDKNFERGMYSGLKGTVKKKSDSPFPPYYEYDVEWDNGRNLKLIPNEDVWMIEKSKPIKESFDVDAVKRSKNFLKYVRPNTPYFKFMRELQKSGLVNMILESLSFPAFGEDRLKNYILGQGLNIDDYEDLLSVAEEAKSSLLNGVYKYSVDKNEDNYDRILQTLLKEGFSLYVTGYKHFVEDKFD